MTSKNMSFGDRVKHNSRPEWGIGTVVKIETAPLNGHTSQRLSIRFPNAGIKTLIAEHAELQRVEDDGDPLGEGDMPAARAWDKYNEGDWLSPVARRKVLEALMSLPADIRDPFISLQKRLHLMFRLYRFDKSGKGLVDWAVAQTGIDDPLSRFSRQELEQHFARYAYERDGFLQKMLQEARGDAAVVHAALVGTPPAAKDAVRRINGSR